MSFLPSFLPSFRVTRKSKANRGRFEPLESREFLFADAAALIGLNDLSAEVGQFDGTGMTVAIIDAGFDVSHPMLGADLDGNGRADNIVFTWDFDNGPPIGQNAQTVIDQGGMPVPIDSTAENWYGEDNVSEYSHGTLIASIIARVAPGAKIVCLSVGGEGGQITNPNSIEDALTFLRDHHGKFDNLVAVNTSFGDQDSHYYPEQALGFGQYDGLYQSLWNDGVVTVASAGNAWSQFDGVYPDGTPEDTDPEGLAYPAISEFTLSVGAVMDSNIGSRDWFPLDRLNSPTSIPADWTTAPDRMASFSQRHSVALDVVAPGVLIEGARPGGGTVVTNGTSFAAPFVVGAIARVQHAWHAETGEMLESNHIRRLFRNVGQEIVDSEDFGSHDNVKNTGGEYRRLDINRVLNFITGDVNGDLTISPDDIDTFYDALQSGTLVRQGDTRNSFEVLDYDLNNGTTNEDIVYYIHEILDTFFGDANLDGVFDSSDMVSIFTSGDYEDSIEDNSGWAEGDFNGDDDVTTADLVLAFEDGGYENG